MPIGNIKHAGSDSTFNLANIVSRLREIEGEIYPLGVQLGIDTSTLKTIVSNDRCDCKQQMIDVVDYWHRNSRSCSWRKLATAVEKIGGHHNLVEELNSLEESGRPQIFSSLALYDNITS